MIELTRLNGSRLAVNSDLILFAEATPDTLLTMVTGEKLIVTENLTEVAARMADFRARTIADASRLCSGGLTVMVGAELPARAAQAAAEAVHEGDDGDVDEESAEVMRRRRRSQP
jgi:flagellar protein FlbD